ncbi:MAG: class II aldolase/adducin family protein [Gammaproteobacteria bacterium]
MNGQEGVIKYSLEHSRSDLEGSIDISRINAWRHMLFKLNLIGQSPEKYQGAGYGNISQRLYPGALPFLITGTQTGHLEYLKAEDFAIVEAAFPKHNAIRSRGPCKPSSEALTHAAVYQYAPGTRAVIHVHCPEIWLHTKELRLPYTNAEISYGTADMAEAVKVLFASGQVKKVPIFCMLGHEDGVVAFGDTLENAALTLLGELANALAIEQSSGAS